MSESGTPRCVVVGGGGHARVVIDALQSVGVTVHGILDRNSELWGSKVLGVPVLGGDEMLSSLKATGANCFLLGVGSVKRTVHRRRLYEEALRSGLAPLTLVHPAAHQSRWTRVGAGTVVLAGAILNAGAETGINTIVNSGAILEHGCFVGDHTHVATGARLLGDVRVGADVFVGAGVTIKQGVTVGDRAVVGAGSVVLENVSDDVTVVGVPARPVARS